MEPTGSVIDWPLGFGPVIHDYGFADPYPGIRNKYYLRIHSAACRYLQKQTAAIL